MISAKLIYSIFLAFLIVVFISSCKRGDDNLISNVDNSEVYLSGQSLFGEKCDRCHLANLKDKLFKSLIDELKKPDAMEIELLKSAFNNPKHIEIDLTVDRFSEEEIRQLLAYIKQPLN